MKSGALVVNGGTHYVCSMVQSASATAASTGNAAADGTFSTTTPGATSTSASALTLSGTAPATANASWSGKYSYVTPPANCGTVSDSFTAQRVADVTGTYSMTANVTTGTNTYQGVKFTFTITQGTQPNPNVSYSKNLLDVSTAISGLPCATTGKNATSTTSGLSGDYMLVSQTLADGSYLQFDGNLQDMAASQISVRTLVATAGVGSSCGFSAAPTSLLIRQ